MEHAETAMTEKEYLTGILLARALSKFGKLNADYLAGNSPKLKNSSDKKDFWGTLDFIRDQLLQFQTQQIQQKEIYSELKNQVLDQIQSGELIAFGYFMPRSIENKPQRIPADLFFSGEVRWELSELVFNEIAVSGIRLIHATDFNNPAALNSSTTPKLNESAVLNFAELDKNLHISEKEAAKYLGMSPRTLQGYRLKGGGPPYRKFNKTVRYKISDLMQWTEKQSKINTAQ